jgi:hypothetical protein
MRLLSVFTLALLSLSIPAPVAAQGVQTGTLRVTVLDAQDRVMDHVTVTVTSPALQGIRTTMTDDEGRIVLTALPPGDYELKFEQTNFQPVTLPVAVGTEGEYRVTMQLAAVTGPEVVVTPTLVATPVAGLVVRHEEVESLPSGRDLTSIALLSPGVSDYTPNVGQLNINGAFGFDNAFLVNGVDLDDNVFGNPQELFIEDAIQETQVLASGISAEYGRFTGGVVNAVTRSGGNRMSGSLRLNLTNPAWTTETPLETSAGLSHESDLNDSWEGTLGGPIVRDRLWFFGGGRAQTITTSGSLPRTNVPHVQKDENFRGEIKVTGTVATNHTVQWGYLNNHTTQDRYANFPFTIDEPSLIDRGTRNWYTVGNYRGVLGSSVLAEAQYAERRFSFVDAGGTSRDIVDSPFVTFAGDAQFNAPYFDAADQEERNSRQLTGNLTFFLTGAGRHELKTGYEWFRSQNIGANSPSATGHVFYADYATDTAGNPAFDSTGYLVPLFAAGAVGVEIASPQPGATLNIDTSSAFVQDHWTLTPRWSADVGARFEHVSSLALPDRIEGINAASLFPRLATAYDLSRNGAAVVRVTYGWYGGRHNPTLLGRNTNVGTPDLLRAIYAGPTGAGRGFAPGFDVNNYQLVEGVFPTSNVLMDPDLRSPTVREFTASFGAAIGDQGRGYGEVLYVHRGTDDLIEDTISLENGVTEVVRGGIDFGPFTNVLVTNSDDARRVYDALQFQANYKFTPRWSLTAHYTVELRNDGNYEGEATNVPGVTSRIGDYPEAFTADRAFPDGRLQNFERQRMRVWTTYDWGLGRYGALMMSGLWRFDSGRVYSLVAETPQLSGIQMGLLSGYPNPPLTQTIFFGERGAQTFPGAHLFDISIAYNATARGLRPYVKFDVFNLFNNQKEIGFNTTVAPDFDGPVDALGIPTTYIPGPAFGRADDPRHYPAPYGSVTGGRSARVAIGLRF